MKPREDEEFARRLSAGARMHDEEFGTNDEDDRVLYDDWDEDALEDDDPQ